MSHIIKQIPRGRKDSATYYAQANGRAHWTQFRELALSFVKETDALHLASQIVNRSGNKTLEVVPL